MDIRSQIMGLLDYTERMASLSERAVFRLADYRALVFHEQELRNRPGIHHDLVEGEERTWLSSSRSPLTPGHSGASALSWTTAGSCQAMGCPPCTIRQEAYRMVGRMADNVHELRPGTGDTEKITINLGYVDLGHIDLMVQEGFYSNRSDFIRTAIRNQLERHADAVKRSVAHKSLDLGLRHYSCEDLEAIRAAGQTLHIHVLGLASIAHDVTPELARATIESVVVLGALRASPAVKAALADRIR
jgi:Arc/MetJ-type ribon-helix-helix transcriptional regulator